MYFLSGFAIGLLCGPFVLAAIDLYCGLDEPAQAPTEADRLANQSKLS